MTKKFLFTCFALAAQVSSASESVSTSEPVPSPHQGYFERTSQTLVDETLSTATTFTEFLEKIGATLSKREYQLLERYIKKNGLIELPTEKAQGFSIYSVIKREFILNGVTLIYNPKLKLKRRVELIKSVLEKMAPSENLTQRAFLLTVVASATVGNELSQYAQNVERCRKKIDEPVTEPNPVQIVTSGETQATYHPGQALNFEFKFSESQKRLKLNFSKKNKKVFTVILDETGSIVHSRPLSDVSEVKLTTAPAQLTEKLPADIKPGKYHALLCVETPKNLLGTTTVDGASHTFLVAQDSQAARVPASKPALKKHSH